MNSHALIFMVFSFLLSRAQGAEKCPDQVRVTFPDLAVPPFINGKGLSFSDSPGVLVDWVREAVARTGCPATIHINRRPKMRAYVELDNGQVDILIPVARGSGGRSSHLVFPSDNCQNDQCMALRGLNFSLWVRKGDRSIQWNGKDLTGPARFRVGTAAGSVSQLIIVERGWLPEPARDSINSIEKLIAGRVAVILIADIVVHGIPEDRRLLIEKLKPGLETVNFYSGASRNFYARYPVFMKKYWEALQEIASVDSTQITTSDIPEKSLPRTK